MAIPNEQAAIPQRIEEKIHRLEELMSIHQLYHDPDLTRAIVAGKIGISEGYLSELIKVGLKTSFNDYVNEFRVKRVIAMFHDEKFDLFSIEAIGFEAGFKSKSVFYDAFKKVTKKRLVPTEKPSICPKKSTLQQFPTFTFLDHQIFSSIPSLFVHL
ncbi:MAG: helix-turn-helix transcriptional regulator [Saprospiraceae bacterium]|nr:helix-turn-helix transcriptional regulator [Saprospiraceae bacterium]